jgi:hypothetical protein
VAIATRCSSNVWQVSSSRSVSARVSEPPMASDRRIPSTSSGATLGIVGNGCSLRLFSEAVGYCSAAGYIPSIPTRSATDQQANGPASGRRGAVTRPCHRSASGRRAKTFSLKDDSNVLQWDGVVQVGLADEVLWAQQDVVGSDHEPSESYPSESCRSAPPRRARRRL